MDTLEAALQSVKTITFDCYGTLIDWRKGLSESFTELLGDEIGNCTDEIFAVYVPAEAVVEAGPYQPYRRVLADVARRVAREFDITLPEGKAEVLAERLPDWTPFPDTNEALARLKKRFQLGVLSNVDRDLFAGTARSFDVEFDFVITAQDVASYKPSHAHFQRLLQSYGPPERILHIAQSLFHDGVPTMELSIPYVWLNRYGETNTTRVEPAATFADLHSFAERAVP